MEEEQQDEVTPLLQFQNCNGSNLKLPSVDFERQNQNGITFYGSPNTSSAMPNPQYPQHWHTNGPRSDTSSLATLATDKKMSDPRRTFCLFVTFDVLLTGLLWLIEVGMSTNDNQGGFFDVLHDQIVYYTPYTSLFDVAILAFCRFALLVVCYAAFRVRHYWPVAASTAISDALLIVKIFAIFPGFGGKHQQTLNVPITIVCILTDFILTWIEVWFIDFKVIPAETKLAQKTAQAFLQQSYRPTPAVDTMGRRSNFQSGGPRSLMEAGAFYSPAATPPPSEGGFTGIESMYYSMHGFRRSNIQLTPEETRITHQGKDGLNKLWEMYQNTEMWQPEKFLDNGDVVYATETSEYGKSFKIESNINGRSADVIFNEILLQPEDMPNWNKTVADVKILKRVGDQTFISLEVSAPAAMGLIASREFVTVRRIEKRGNSFVSAGISTDQCDEFVPKSNFVRGVNGPTGFIVSPNPADANSSKFVWILNTDLKGNLSRSLVNRNLTRTLIDFVSAMKSRLQLV